MDRVVQGDQHTPLSPHMEITTTTFPSPCPFLHLILTQFSPASSTHIPASSRNTSTRAYPSVHPARRYFLAGFHCRRRLVSTSGVYLRCLSIPCESRVCQLCHVISCRLRGLFSERLDTGKGKGRRRKMKPGRRKEEKENERREEKGRGKREGKRVGRCKKG